MLIIVIPMVAPTSHNHTSAQLYCSLAQQTILKYIFFKFINKRTSTMIELIKPIIQLRAITKS